MSKTIVIDGREILGSTGRYTRKLLDHLQALDSSNNYHVLLHPEAMAEVQLAAANFHKVEVPERKFTLAEQLSLPSRINSLKPDLVHFPMVNQPAFLGIKTITTIHDLTPLRFTDPLVKPLRFAARQRVFGWLVKRAAHKAKTILVDTNYVKNDLVKTLGIPEAKIHIVNLAADKITAEVVPIEALQNKQFIFYVGRAQSHKNLAGLIKAFETVHVQKPDLVLALAGKKSGNYEHIEAQARASSTASSIIFTDFVSEGQLRWLYENSVAYIFPSLSEGFGLPGLEAMAHNCPLISSNASCLPEVYGDAAYYFDPASSDDMAQKILEVVSNQKLRSELVEKGAAQAAKYSWARMAQQTLAIYNSVA